MANDFKVGDRVVALDNYQDAAIKGKSGVVVTGNHGRNDKYVGVQFDEKLKSTDGNGIGHTCGGNGKQGYCWNVPAILLKLEEDAPAIFPFDNIPTEPVECIDYPIEELTELEKTKIIIASANYPYAIKSPDGDLWFYKTLPTCYSTVIRVIHTGRVAIGTY